MSESRSTNVLLVQAVLDGDLDAMMAALEAGANVDGLRGQPVPPIVAATMANQVVMLNVLLRRGADPDRPIPGELAWMGIITFPGERALHIAARGGNTVIVRLLLNLSHPDPNATDGRGCTPLSVTCDSSFVCVEVVRLLLEAGADPALTTPDDGWTPLHVVAINGYMELVDMLYAAAPSTLNRYTTRGETPLFVACAKGRENIVSRLVELGAMEPMPIDDETLLPLSTAVTAGFVGVVRILLNEAGFRAIGGGVALPNALYNAVRYRRPTILRLLLAAEGQEKRSELANARFHGKRLLHGGTGYCYPTAVSILLEAGADAAARDPEGRIPGDTIGVCLDRDDVFMKRGNEVAISRMLERGPAYRARSWAWPSNEEANAGGSGDSDTAGAATAAAGVLSLPPAMSPPHVVNVRTFRPKETSSRSKFFVRLVGRYCVKN